MTDQNKGKDATYTPWRVFWMVENSLSLSIWSSDSSSLIVAVGAAAVVFRMLQPLKLPTAERMPVYLAGCIVNKLVTTGIENAV